MGMQLAACAQKKANSDAESVPSPDALGVVDPDPDAEVDAQASKLCNPTGKSGEALSKCYEQNETVYKQFDEDAKKREPWFSFPSDSWAESQELDPKLIVKLAPQHEPAAVKRLENEPAVELSESEVAQLTGKAEKVAGLKPYLVRGLFYFRDTGNFAVYRKSGAILVQHDSVGTTMPRENRSGVVVYLPEKPKQIFVDCSVTE